VDLSNVEIVNAKLEGMTIEGVPVQALFAAYDARQDKKDDLEGGRDADKS